MLGKYLRLLTVDWLSPDNDEERFDKTGPIRCKDCCRKYQKLTVAKKELERFRRSLIVIDSALREFKNIFPNHDFTIWFGHVLYLVQPEHGVIHIIFRFFKIKAFLDCRIIQGVLTVVSVERIF